MWVSLPPFVWTLTDVIPQIGTMATAAWRRNSTLILTAQHEHWQRLWRVPRALNHLHQAVITAELGCGGATHLVEVRSSRFCDAGKSAQRSGLLLWNDLSGKISPPELLDKWYFTN